MKEILDKISSYNLFNYLLPGVVFALLGQHLQIIALPKGDPIVLSFVYYFIGMIVSRVGSLTIEPVFKALKVVTYSPYADYLKASEKDPKMAVMVEASNTYRTLAATFLALAIGLLITTAADKLSMPVKTREYWLVGGLFVLFAYSFRKQSAFIASRVQHYTD